MVCGDPPVVPKLKLPKMANRSLTVLMAPMPTTLARGIVAFATRAAGILHVLELAQARQAGFIVKAVHENVEVLDHLALERPGEIELVLGLAEPVLGTGNPEVVLEPDAQRQRLVEEDVHRGLRTRVERG